MRICPPELDSFKAVPKRLRLKDAKSGFFFGNRLFKGLQYFLGIVCFLLFFWVSWFRLLFAAFWSLNPSSGWYFQKFWSVDASLVTASFVSQICLTCHVATRQKEQGTVKRKLVQLIVALISLVYMASTSIYNIVHHSKQYQHAGVTTISIYVDGTCSFLLPSSFPKYIDTKKSRKLKEQAPLLF